MHPLWGSAIARFLFGFFFVLFLFLPSNETVAYSYLHFHLNKMLVSQSLFTMHNILIIRAERGFDAVVKTKTHFIPNNFFFLFILMQRKSRKLYNFLTYLCAITDFYVNFPIDFKFKFICLLDVFRIRNSCLSLCAFILHIGKIYRHYIGILDMSL